MTLHLLKLAVAAESVDGLRGWVAARSEPWPKGVRAVRIITRTAPRRADEVLAGGSLYWVIKGCLSARQRILALEPFVDGAGTDRVHIVLEADVVAVRPRPCRPFQGWRYLPAADAPADLVLASGGEGMHPEMRRDLVELCLL